jgi:hypothetical protein
MANARTRFDHDFSGTNIQLRHGRLYCYMCGFDTSKTGCHEKSLSRLKASETTVSSIERRASKLFDTWKNRVLAQLLRHKTPGVTDHCIFPFLEEAQRLLEKYERMELLSLLELAVWKATCTQLAGEVKVDPQNVRTVEDAIRFVDAIRFAKKQRSAWRDYKTEMRHSNAIEIILSQVIPFVG